MKSKKLIISLVVLAIGTLGFAVSALAQDKTAPSKTVSKTSIETDNSIRTKTTTKTVKAKKSKNGKKQVTDTKVDTKVETDQKK
jgi:hypothetical protein